MSGRVLDEEEFVRRKLMSGDRSALRRYADLTVGGGWLSLLRYELVVAWLGPLPGALGLLLRRLTYPALFRACGRGLVIGRNVIVRHGHNIRLGSRVVIDDGVLLDGRGAGAEGLVIGDDVIIGRGAYVQSKAGPLRIGAGSDVGAGSVLVSHGGLSIGERVSLGGGCKISGGRFTPSDDPEADPPFERFTGGPIEIGDRCLLGGGVIVTDAVSIGAGSLVGAGSVVVKSVGPGSVCTARPALVLQAGRDTGSGTPG